MDKVRQDVILLVAVVLIGLGLLNIGYRDSLMTWQPFPDGAAGRALFAYLSGAVLILSGAGMLIPAWRTGAAAVAASWLALGAIVFHLPHIVKAHDVAALLGLAEASACALGLATLTGWFDTRPRANAHRLGFGLCLLVFGISHFVYAGFTAAMVPAWLPQRLGIAYLTGAIHILTGLALLAGLRVRTAATIEALMMSSFVLLLHIPGVIAAPHDRLQLTMLGMASLLTCAAWLVASSRALPGGGLLSRRAPS
ncbi:DoxX family membrane protein [Sphingomonas crusticola]|uniref:DoxX family membrane protein n=1 Tax=Sphingomonas crusticola TaxID=1697973 RepID=UPI000E27CFA0|nr:DoxX family membrane protein [Sphingomonas crusticola]